MRGNCISRIILIVAFVSLTVLPVSANAPQQTAERDSRSDANQTIKVPYWPVKFQYVDSNGNLCTFDIFDIDPVMILADERGRIIGWKRIFWLHPDVNTLQAPNTAPESEVVIPDPIRTPNPDMTQDASGGGNSQTEKPVASSSEDKVPRPGSVAPNGTQDASPLHDSH